MIFSQGKNAQIDPYITDIRQKLKQGSSLGSLNKDLTNLSQSIDELLKSNSSTENSLPSAPLSGNALCINLLEELLNGINIPTKFQSNYHVIRQKLKKALDADNADSAINSAASLILSINNHIQSEQLETEKFLEDISSQLNQLDQQTNIAKESSLASYSDRETLDAAIHFQIDNIKNSASTALELSALQRNVSQYLQELTSELHKYKRDEDHRLRETQRQLAEMSEKLQDLETETQTLRNNLKLAHAKAFCDPLTGMPNRLAYNEKIDLEFKNWKRYKNPVSMIIWDVDYFKNINDVYGHKAGDKTLSLFAHLMKRSCRETDFIARYGGEEFVMLLHNTKTEQALIVAEKFRTLIAGTDFNYQGKKVDFTISCGISEFMEKDLRHEDVFERADQALYQSKENGRNRCTVYR